MGEGRVHGGLGWMRRGRGPWRGEEEIGVALRLLPLKEVLCAPRK